MKSRRGRRDDLVLHLVRRLRVLAGRRGCDADAVRALRVAELVEHLVARGAVVLERARGSCSRTSEIVPGEALDLVRVAVEDDLDDLVAVDAHRERLLHLRIEELAVLRLVRVRVPGDVRRLGARNLLTTMFVVLLEDVDRVERHLVDPVEPGLTSVGDHRVRVRVVRQRDRLGRCDGSPVVVRFRDEDGRSLLLVLLQREGAARDERTRGRSRVRRSSGPCRRPPRAAPRRARGRRRTARAGRARFRPASS